MFSDESAATLSAEFFLGVTAWTHEWRAQTIFSLLALMDIYHTVLIDILVECSLKDACYQFLLPLPAN
jgi:hypothetical protein